MEIQWSLVAFTTITAAAGWLSVCIAADEFLGKARGAAFWAAVVAFVLAAVGGLASVTHLSHVENIMGAFGHPTSGIFTEALLVFLLCAFTFVYALLVKRGAGAGARKAFGVIVGIVGLILSFSVGMSYMMASRPSWNTPLLPLGYLGTAIPLGIAVFMTVARKLDAACDLGVYAKGLAVGGVLAIVFAALFVLTSGCINGTAVALLAGCVVLDGIVPILVGLKLAKGAGAAPAGDEAAAEGGKPAAGSLNLIVAALICTAVGAACFRISMWVLATPIADLFGIAI